MMRPTSWIRRLPLGRRSDRGGLFPPVSIVTVTRDGYFYVRLLVEKVREFTKSRNYEIIVVDRGSVDQTLAWLNAQPDVRILRLAQGTTEGHGHGEAAELGVKAARYSRIVLLDSDAFPFDEGWLNRTTDLLDERRRLGGAKMVQDHRGNPHGWYVHPHFMSFFKADLGGLIVLRKVRGDDTDTGEEATLRVLSASYETIAHPITLCSELSVGRPDIPTLAGGVFHAWYTSRLEHSEDEVIRETGGAISRKSYSIPLQEGLRSQLRLDF